MRSVPLLIAGLLLAVAVPLSPQAVGTGDCEWLSDPELIARCEVGGGSPGGGGIPEAWLDFGKGWRVMDSGVCPNGSPRVFRLLHWLEGTLFGDPVTAYDFGWRFGPGDVVPYAPRRSDGSPAIFGSDGLVPDIGYCVSPLDGVDLAAEIRRRAPVGQLVTNPLAEGLTGLDTWLWYEGGIDIPPFTLSFTDPASGVAMEIEAWAHLESFTWDMGDGTILTSFAAGSGDDLPGSASVIHRYERKADYTIAFTAGWNGTYRWRELPAGGWSSPIPFAGNPATVTTLFAYPVVEVRSVLQP